MYTITFITDVLPLDHSAIVEAEPRLELGLSVPRRIHLDRVSVPEYTEAVGII